MRCAADFRADARRALKGHWGIAVGIGFLAALLGAAKGVGTPEINFGFGDDGFQTNLQLLGQNLNLQQLFQNGSSGDFFTETWVYFSGIAVLIAIAQLIIGCMVSVGYVKFNMDLIDGEEGKVETLFRYFPQWKTMLAAGLLQMLYVFLWSLLLIIPGVIAAYRYSMTHYILAENPEMGANDAITRSKELMKGNKWRLFCLQLSFIGWMILCLFTLGIGNLWLTPYMMAANAAFYRDLIPLEQPAAEETPTEESSISE